MPVEFPEIVQDHKFLVTVIEGHIDGAWEGQMAGPLLWKCNRAATVPRERNYAHADLRKRYVVAVNEVIRRIVVCGLLRQTMVLALSLA